MLLGVLLVVLVLYGLLLFWVLNERLREVHHLLQSLSKKVERMEGKLQGLPGTYEEENKEWSIAEERFPVYTLESEALKRKGEEE